MALLLLNIKCFLTDHEDGFLSIWASLFLLYVKGTLDTHMQKRCMEWVAQPSRNHQEARSPGQAKPRLSAVGWWTWANHWLWAREFSARGSPEIYLSQLTCFVNGESPQGGTNSWNPLTRPLSFIPGDTPPWLSIFSTMKETQITVNAFPVLSFCSHYLIPLLHSQ